MTALSDTPTPTPALLDHIVERFARIKGLTPDEARAYMIRIQEESDGKGEAEVVKGTEDATYQYSSHAWRLAHARRRKAKK